MGDLRDGETRGFCDGSAESVEIEGGFDLFPVQQEQGAEKFGGVAKIDLSSRVERAMAGAAFAFGLPEAKECEAMRLDDDDGGEVEHSTRDVGRIGADFLDSEIE